MSGKFKNFTEWPPNNDLFISQWIFNLKTWNLIHIWKTFVLVVKRFKVVCTLNLETAHNLMSLGWILRNDQYQKLTFPKIRYMDINCLLRTWRSFLHMCPNPKWIPISRKTEFTSQETESTERKSYVIYLIQIIIKLAP